MKNIKGSQTEKNLAAAFVAEACAFARYTFFAKAANEENFFQFEQIFKETAENELHHAKVFLKLIALENVTTPPINVDAGKIGSTLENLDVAISEEDSEGVKTYLDRASVADEEGFLEIANTFRAIAEVESSHKRRFQAMKENIVNDSVWNSDQPIKWVCNVCGYIHQGMNPPAKCPACNHPFQHFFREY